MALFNPVFIIKHVLFLLFIYVLTFESSQLLILIIYTKMFVIIILLFDICGLIK